jgi:hypothetical protein
MEDEISGHHYPTILMMGSYSSHNFAMLVPMTPHITFTRPCIVLCVHLLFTLTFPFHCFKGMILDDIIKIYTKYLIKKTFHEVVATSIELKNPQ